MTAVLAGLTMAVLNCVIHRAWSGGCSESASDLRVRAVSVGGFFLVDWVVDFRRGQMSDVKSALMASTDSV
jgi:hypothetical protein